VIGEVIDKLKDMKYFKKLDLIWEYNNMWIKEDDKWKVVFLTNKRLFKLKVIYFGLCNLPRTFQWIMKQYILRAFTWKSISELYKEIQSPF